eukprot:TRINITY_DN4509_c0_g1_i1.p1 TRINITY_DN4509_c0_g1~~TRINITY_DN4509_c0_g1_i1.p1  ORF type:complete len:356 (+),score=64.18 TRINITY_DN4509_c0_g1_i1:212-1279(+)
MQAAGFIGTCICVFLTSASGLVRQQPLVPDVSSSFLQQPVSLSDRTNGVITRSTGTDLQGQDWSERARQAKVQNLLSAEQAALLSQEQAIEQIAAQQASLAQQQAELKRREAKVEAEIAKKLAGASFSQTATSSSSRSGVRARVRQVSDWLQKNWKEQLIGAAVWLVLTMFCGWAYGAYFTYEYPQLRKEPMVTRQGFSFGLCDGYSCDPDTRVCCFSHFCLPVRWADTASSPKVGFVTFWTGLFIYTLAAALNGLSYGITGLICLTLAVRNRQQIRERYGMPNGSFGTVVADIAVWLCCIPCAAMQEAMEVEFVDAQGGLVPRTMQKVMQQTMGRSDTDRFLPNERAQRQNTCC